MIRTHDAGSLRAEHAGQTVTLAGWVARRRDHGGVTFIDLREASGVVQVVVRDEAVAHQLRSEFCLKVTGEVGLRPEGNANPELPTGEIEVVAVRARGAQRRARRCRSRSTTTSTWGRRCGSSTATSTCAARRPTQAIRLRSKVNKAARDVLDDHGFVEIETPTLTRSTPEGARDFLVPARLQPGSWYALPQSPQLFKQLLMVAGMERYYQIARCYRDEDFRADRQPEFTQLDIEMSFVDQDDVLAVAEDVLAAVWSLVGYDLPRPLPRMTYAEAMARFGTDKPDLRMGLELVECTDYFKDTPFRVFQAPYVGAVVMPGGAGQPRKQLDAWQEWAKQRGARGLAYVLVQEDGELGGPVAKNLSEEERAGLAAHVGAEPGDCVFFAAGLPKPSRALLGAARLEIGRRGGLIDEDAWSFLWVVDAPLFEPADEATAAGDVAVGGGAWTAVHHAFTSPQDLETFDQDPGDALAWAYDVVCNGNEIGGGSIRIHREDVQKRVFAVMGIDEAEAQEKFGFLLDAFTYGAPPHGGIAFGWDRITALLAAHRLDPRGDRVPEVRRRGGPADRSPGADHGRTAQGSRCGRRSDGRSAGGRGFRLRFSSARDPFVASTACGAAGWLTSHGVRASRAAVPTRPGRSRSRDGSLPPRDLRRGLGHIECREPVGLGPTKLRLRKGDQVTLTSDLESHGDDARPSTPQAMSRRARSIPARSPTQTRAGPLPQGQARDGLVRRHRLHRAAAPSLAPILVAVGVLDPTRLNQDLLDTIDGSTPRAFGRGISWEHPLGVEPGTGPRRAVRD